MTHPRILIVDANRKRVQAIRDALSGTVLPQPIHREDGESAVLWTGANACDLCILSYELPGINGLETLARMRTRRPDLTAMMVAESTDQHVAIAAFRAGVVDFVPATGAFAGVVAERAQRVFGDSANTGTVPHSILEDPTLAHIPVDRLEPTYQNRLRSIGRQLDVYQYQSITILEVEGGFLVRAQKQRSRRPQALEFPDNDFPRLVASAIHEEVSEAEKPIHQSDLTPTGYEDLLRAIGHRLDEISASTVVITELAEMFIVAGLGNDERSAVAGLTPFTYFLKLEDIEYMLNEAFRRRGKLQPRVEPPSHSPGGIRRILRRLN